MVNLSSILVTGANQGLGYHAVHQLGAMKNVLFFIGSRKLAGAEEVHAKFAGEIHSSFSVVPVQLDITDAGSIKNAFIAEYFKVKNLPGLDVVVNKCALTIASHRIYSSTYAANVFGTAALTEAIQMLLNNGGAILNMSSTLASLHTYTQRPPPPIYLAYIPSKSALNSLTLQLALQEEEKKSGIRVVSVYPGFNQTNLNNYMGTMKPEDGAKVMVEAALAKNGKSGVFFNEEGEVEW
ncbi:hypothetical protein K438DRAFT_1969757 [Mycena galopus ATCC 62051]|nr:hypothetical protein K438DRAFT_1969757 [Mycena galopus ATCC 62051]